jgi:hypothetical protein
MEYYETEFVNKRKSSVDVLEDGKTLLMLAPGQTKWVESQSPGTSYAPFLKVVFKEDGSVKLDENRAWKFPNPNNLLMLEIVNIDGAGSETFYLGMGEPVRCYKGIPRFVGVDIHDAEWAFVEKMEIRNVEHKDKQGDYIARRTTLERVKTMRSKSEIKAIEKRLYDEAVLKVKLDLKRRFPNAQL